MLCAGVSPSESAQTQTDHISRHEHRTCHLRDGTTGAQVYTDPLPRKMTRTVYGTKDTFSGGFPGPIMKNVDLKNPKTIAKIMKNREKVES